MCIAESVSKLMSVALCLTVRESKRRAEKTGLAAAHPFFKRQMSSYEETTSLSSNTKIPIYR